MRRQFGVQHALGIARSAVGQRRFLLQQGYRPAAPRQRRRRRRAGNAAAQHQRASLAGVARPGKPRRAPGRRGRRGQLAAQHMPLAAKASHPPHAKARLGQPALDHASRSKRGVTGPRRRQPRQLGKQRGRPKLRVARRGKAIQKPGVHRAAGGVQLRQGVQRVAHQQGERDCALIKTEAMPARPQRGILRQQRLAELGQLGPQGQRARQLLGGDGVFFGADHMQPRARWRTAPPQLPGAQDIQPGAKAGLAQHKAAIRRQGRPALGQAVMRQKHMAGFIQAAIAGEIHIAKPGGHRLAILPIQQGA